MVRIFLGAVLLVVLSRNGLDTPTLVVQGLWVALSWGFDTVICLKAQVRTLAKSLATVCNKPIRDSLSPALLSVLGPVSRDIVPEHLDILL